MSKNQTLFCLKMITTAISLTYMYLQFVTGETGFQQYEAVFNITMNEDCFSNNTYACEPGYHINHEDTLCDNDRKCCVCPPNTYQPWWNECYSCILCTNCTEMQKQTMHHCNITNDSVCGKHFFTTSVPEAEATSTIPSSTQVSPHAITPEEEITPKPPEDSDDPVQDEDVKEEENDYGFWCEPISYTLAHFVTHSLCLLPGILFIVFPAWAQFFNDKVNNAYRRCKDYFYRNSNRRNSRSGRGQYNQPQAN